MKLIYWLKSGIQNDTYACVCVCLCVCVCVCTHTYWSRAQQPTPVLLPGESPWTEESGGLLSMGLQRVRHNWSDLACTHTHIYIYTDIHVYKFKITSPILWILKYYSDMSQVSFMSLNKYSISVESFKNLDQPHKLRRKFLHFISDSFLYMIYYVH